MKKLLIYKEVAEIYRVTPRAVRIWAKNGTIPIVRLSAKTIRFDPDAIQKHLESLQQSAEK